MPAPFEIVTDDCGNRHASDGRRTVSLNEVDGRVFRRRAVKGFGSPAARNVEWVVVELDGVRVYVDGDAVLVTRRDLMP